MSESVHLEGTTLEGGGQLVRLALGLSALTATPIKITNIRGNRSGGGGLKQQHLTAVNWLTSACSATVSGAEKKNRTLEFCPAKEVTAHKHYWVYDLMILFLSIYILNNILVPRGTSNFAIPNRHWQPRLHNTRLPSPPSVFIVHIHFER